MTSPRKSVSDVTAQPNRPFLEGSSSANITPNVSHFYDPVRALPSLPTPPSVNKTVTLRTKFLTPGSSLAKSLFLDGEDKEQAVELGAKVLEDTGDLSGTDQNVKEDAVVDTESPIATPVSNDKRRRAQTGKGAAGASLKKAKP